MADVCGKGPDAAAITSLLRHAIRSRSLYESDPARLLQHANDVLRRHDSTDTARFVTAQIARLRPDEHGRIDIALASAGHPPPVLLRGTAPSFVETPGRLLGLFDDIAASTTEFALTSGDGLVFYTDGVTEARDPEGAMFGEPRLLGSVELAARRAMNADAMLSQLERAVRAHVGDENLRDDVALLAVRAL